MSALESAAARYCEAKELERRLVKAMRRCERRTYDPETRPQVPFCSRTMVMREGMHGPYEEELPEADWCEACRANLPARDDLRDVRRRFPGLMSAMRRAHRAAASAPATALHPHRDPTNAAASLDASSGGSRGGASDASGGVR